MDDGGARTVKDRMESLGWQLGACEDTCAAQWMKVEPDGRVSAYEGGGAWNADLERCQREYGYLDGRSAYA